MDDAARWLQQRRRGACVLLLHVFQVPGRVEEAVVASYERSRSTAVV